MANYTNEHMLDMFIFETVQLIEQLEQAILISEKAARYDQQAINEIFRIMHTIKGSSAMMAINNISTLAHSIEDLFFFLREEKPSSLDYSTLSDLILDGIDFIKIEIEKIKNSDTADGVSEELISRINSYLHVLKSGKLSLETEPLIQKPELSINQDKDSTCSYSNEYEVILRFEEDCQMENIRAYSLIHNLKDWADDISYIPDNIIDDDSSVNQIRENGFKIHLKSASSYDKIQDFFNQTLFLKSLDITQMNTLEKREQPIDEKGRLTETAIKESNSEHHGKDKVKAGDNKEILPKESHTPAQNSIVSVSVPKLDKLMDLVGEMVIAEAMVIQNPDLRDLDLDNFQKAARQLSKITSEIQDMVMSIRMVSVSTTFHKMHRIVRDMCKKLNKEVELEIIGEETEVDKNIIEHISDPIMHLVRNSLDHGIESSQDRIDKGKSPQGTITLEAKNAGSDVLIMVKDDGKGLNKDKILEKARENSLLYKREEDMTDKEIFNLIFLPGFSTKENVTEFSGRGVGMDIVTKSIEAIGGSVIIDSSPNNGTTITLKIPLTLAIIDGMNIKVGEARYTMPTVSIRESFRPKGNEIFMDPDNNEMIMVRGQCYPILRLHEIYKVQTDITEFSEGIIIMIEHDDKAICIFADELLGQQQVVVKALPEYIRRFKMIKGLAGCTLLGDGNISLILDLAGILN